MKVAVTLVIVGIALTLGCLWLIRPEASGAALGVGLTAVGLMVDFDRADGDTGRRERRAEILGRRR